MLLPPSGPTSTWTALGRRYPEENWLRIPWAVTRSGEPADASTATASAVPTALVQALKLCSREVRRQYLAVVFARPRPAYGTPLAQPHAVPPPPRLITAGSVRDNIPRSFAPSHSSRHRKRGEI